MTKRCMPKVVTERIELRPLVDEIEALGTARANESVTIFFWYGTPDQWSQSYNSEGSAHFKRVR